MATRILRQKAFYGQNSNLRRPIPSRLRRVKSGASRRLSNSGTAEASLARSRAFADRPQRVYDIQGEIGPWPKYCVSKERADAPTISGVMVERANVGSSVPLDVANPNGSGRKCVCCGGPTPTPSLCACWDHWMVLPEDLRSELLRSYSRDELTNYHRALLEAVEVWRHAGVWRMSSKAGINT